MKLTHLIRLMRPSHWIKNILVLTPLFFSGNLANRSLLLSALSAFASFSLAASAVYIFNDIMDVDNDRKHPQKCKRPLASGEVTIGAASLLCAVLVFGALALSLLTQMSGLKRMFLLAIYVLINVLYSTCLKRVPLVDVTILAVGYLLRVMFGALAVGVEVSGWLYLTVMAGSFFMGFGKRRGEADTVGSGSRAVLLGYTRAFLDKNMYVCLALTITFYSLWAKEESVRLITVPLVLLILMRYSLDIENGGDGDPMSLVLADGMLISLALLYGAVIFTLIYLPGVI